MEYTGYFRTLDSSGRLVLPAKMRDALNMKQGDIYHFFTHEWEGKTYLCIECIGLENEIEKAKRILREAGIKVDD
jgi:bifunctional DNA-binding transcriptional regulator/antitoxin component of YhaV-PrlF toxin-antitoxin module